jgi:hypothetical protein
LGFPDRVVSGFVELINQEKNIKPTEPVSNHRLVSAVIIDGEVCPTNSQDICRIKWEEIPGFNPKMKTYHFEEYTLFHLKNNEKNIFFRDELPKKAAASLPRDLPKAEEPTKNNVPSITYYAPVINSANPEKKAEMPKTPAVPVQKTEGNGVEKVYEATALPISIQELQNQPMTAIMVPIFKSPWIGDGLGTYTIAEKDGKEVQEFLVRKVWRAYVGNDIYPAIITKFGTYVFVVVPGKTKADLIDEEVVIVSGSGKFALTLLANDTEFNLKKFEESTEYKNTFFQKNPSKVEGKMLVDISPNTENGKAFMKDLKKIFPNEYYVKGKKVSVGTDLETLKSLVGESNNSNYFRRVIQKGGLPNISLSSVACPPCELARMLIVWSIAAFDKTLSGNFREAKVSGYQAAKAMSPYLAECQEEMNYLQKIILQGGKS